MKPVHLLAAFVAGMLCANSAVAASLTVTDINGEWSSSTPVVDGLGTNQIRWGDPAETNRSVYNFSASAVPFTVEDQSEFVIGVFSHENFPVFGQFLDAADLSVSFSLVRVARPIVSTFSFDHTETLNDISGLCPNGFANRAGVNSNGCADKVSATLNRGQSESFVIDGVMYVLDILGFQANGLRLTDFWTQENLSNSAELIAIFRVEEPGPVSEVPLPAAGWLLLLGLAGMNVVRYRR